MYSVKRKRSSFSSNRKGKYINLNFICILAAYKCAKAFIMSRVNSNF